MTPEQIAYALTDRGFEEAWKQWSGVVRMADRKNFGGALGREAFVPWEEVEQAGRLGLWDALKTYDPAKVRVPRPEAFLSHVYWRTLKALRSALYFSRKMDAVHAVTRQFWKQDHGDKAEEVAEDRRLVPRVCSVRSCGECLNAFLRFCDSHAALACRNVSRFETTWCSCGAFLTRTPAGRCKACGKKWTHGEVCAVPRDGLRIQRRAVPRMRGNRAAEARDLPACDACAAPAGKPCRGPSLSIVRAHKVRRVAAAERSGQVSA